MNQGLPTKWRWFTTSEREPLPLAGAQHNENSTEKLSFLFFCGGGCEAIIFLEPRINVRSVQPSVSRRQEANANTDVTRRTRTATDALKTAVETCAMC